MNKKKQQTLLFSTTTKLRVNNNKKKTLSGYEEDTGQVLSCEATLRPLPVIGLMTMSAIPIAVACSDSCVFLQNTHLRFIYCNDSERDLEFLGEIASSGVINSLNKTNTLIPSVTMTYGFVLAQPSTNNSVSQPVVWFSGIFQRSLEKSPCSNTNRQWRDLNVGLRVRKRTF